MGTGRLYRWACAFVIAAGAIGAIVAMAVAVMAAATQTAECRRVTVPNTVNPCSASVDSLSAA